MSERELTRERFESEELVARLRVLYRMLTGETKLSEYQRAEWVLAAGGAISESADAIETLQARAALDTGAVEALRAAAAIMRGEGVEDQGEAYDKALRLIDAALAAIPAGSAGEGK